MFLSAPFFWKSLTRPGCDTEARSGGLPPATAVERTVGVLSPVDLYETLMLGFLVMKPLSTASKDFCSSPLQTPTIAILDADAVDDLVLLALAYAVTASSSTPTIARIATLFFFTLGLLSGSRRYLCLMPDRRNGVRECRRQPSPLHPA